MGAMSLIISTESNALQYGQCPIAGGGYYGIIPCDNGQCIFGAMNDGSQSLIAIYDEIARSYKSSDNDITAFNNDMGQRYNDWGSSLSSAKTTLILANNKTSYSIKSALEANSLAKSTYLSTSLKIQAELQTSLINSITSAVSTTLKGALSLKEIDSMTTPAAIKEITTLATEIYTIGEWYEQLYLIDLQSKAITNLGEVSAQMVSIGKNDARSDLINSVYDANTSQSKLLPKIKTYGLPQNSISQKRIILLKQEKNNMLENYTYRQAMNEFINSL